MVAAGGRDDELRIGLTEALWRPAHWELKRWRKKQKSTPFADLAFNPDAASHRLGQSAGPRIGGEGDFAFVDELHHVT